MTAYRFYLVAALIAISGCSSHDTKNELDGCRAERMKARFQKDEVDPFLLACMGGKGYDFNYKKDCLNLQRTEIFIQPACFYKRSLLNDFLKQLEDSRNQP
jgi:hypothetical protein